MIDTPSETQEGNPRKRQASQLIAIVLTLLGLAFRLFWKPAAPTERLLLHVFRPEAAALATPPGPGGTTPATILLFKTDGQYVERTGYLIDSGKGDLSFAPGDDNVVSVGTWDQQGATLTARRERVARGVPYDGPDLDPLCRSSIVEYHLSGDGVRESGIVFHPSSQLKLTDWETHVSKAKSSAASCRRTQ